MSTNEKITETGHLLTGYDNPELSYQIIRTWGKLFRSVNTYHYHPDIQIDVVLAGTVRYIIEGNEISVSEGDGVFINANIVHRTIPSGADYLSLRFHPDLLSANEYIEKTYISPIVENRGFRYLFLNHAEFWQDSVMEAVRSFYMFDSAGADDMPLVAASQFFYIWHTLFTNLPEKDKEFEETSKEKAMRTMIGFIQKNYNRSVSLSDIAASAGISSSGCSQFFKELIHDSPYHYLLEYRLQQAMIMLCTTGASITEIAENCGFPDTSHFIRSFSGAYGSTPLQYRKSLQKERNR